MGKGIAVLVFVLFAAAAQAQGPQQNHQAAINDLRARIDRLERDKDERDGKGSYGTVAGDYRILGLQTGLMGGSAGLVESIAYTGTLTLTNKGHYSGRLIERRHDLNTGEPATLQSHEMTEPLGGTFAVDGSVISLEGFGGPEALEFYGVPGGKMFFAVASGIAPPPNTPHQPMGTNVLLILVKN